MAYTAGMTTTKDPKSPKLKTHLLALVVAYIANYITRSRRRRYVQPNDGFANIRRSMICSLLSLGAPSQVVIIGGDFVPHQRVPTLHIPVVHCITIGPTPDDPTEIVFQYTC